jgi:hypothetical protein
MTKVALYLLNKLAKILRSYIAYRQPKHTPGHIDCPGCAEARDKVIARRSA